MSFCSHCGGSVPDSARFCPKCGSPAHAVQPAAATMAPTSTSDTMGVVSASMTTVTTATAPVVAEPIPTPYRELESTVQSTPPMAEQVPEEETGTDSAIGEGVDTQDITVNDVPESAEGDEGAKAQPSTDPEELVDTRPSELDEPTPNEPTPTNSEVTGESETKQEDEKPLFSETIDHGEHPEGTDSSPSPQPQTETLETQLHPQEPSQAPYSTGQKSHLASDVTQWNPQTQAQASYPQTQAQAQASYSQQAQPQLPYPQQAQQQASYSQRAQPQLPYPQQQASYSQQAQQQAPYTQPYPQQQASYTQVQVFTNSQPSSGTPTKSKVAAGLLAIFLGIFGVHKFYLGQTNAGASILLFNFILLLMGIFLWWTIIVPIILPLVYLVEGFVFIVEGIIYLVKSDEEFQRDCVRG